MGYKVNQGDENTQLTDAMVYGEEENNSFVVVTEDDNDVVLPEQKISSPEVIQLTSEEESSILNVVETTIHRTYRCRKCGAPKTLGGHGCPAADLSSEVQTPSPLGPQLRRAPRKASNSGNLTRLARYVEENSEESDPDFPVTIRKSPRLNEKRKRSTAVDHTETEMTSKRRKVYTCRKCNIPKKECPCKRTNSRVNRQLNGSPVILLERYDSE